MSVPIIKKFNKFIIAECNQGQPKKGVETGGEFITNNFDIYPHYIIKNKDFNNIDSKINNGYERLSTILEIYNNEKETTMLIGGDHSLGISSVDAFLNIYKEELSVLWIDAHADINDHITSLSGNTHGMPLGYHHIKRTDKPAWRTNPQKLKSSQLYYWGIRDLDPTEEDLIKSENIGYSNTIDTNLMNFINKSKYLLISFDVDSLDPKYMNSTGTMAEKGLIPIDVKTIINYSFGTNKLIHLDVMEFNPLLGDIDKSVETLKEIFL
jgi:arginase